MTLLLPRAVQAATAALLLAAGSACTSDSDPTGSSGAGGQAGTGATAPYNAQPFIDGRSVSETDACKRLEKALEARINDDGCIVTTPLCPGLIRVNTDPADACADYDLGALEGCLGYLDQLPCGELNAASCGQLPLIAGTATGDDSCLPVSGAGGAAGQGESGAGGESGQAGAAGSAGGGGESGSSGQP